MNQYPLDICITIWEFAGLNTVFLNKNLMKFIKRKMGKSWQKLHNLNYLIILLVSVHFFWSVKSEVFEPIFYILLTLIVLSFRRDKLIRLFHFH